MSDTYDYDTTTPEVKKQNTYGTSEDSSPFPPVSRRISLFLIIFLVFTLILALAYIGFIAIYWAINGDIFQWIVVVDIAAAACLLLTVVAGIASVATYVIPIIRLVASGVFFIVLLCTSIIFVVSSIVLRSSFNFDPQAGAHSMTRPLNFALLVVGSIALIFCFLPCLCCSGFQIWVAFGLWREKNNIDPGFLFTFPTRMTIKGFNFVEKMTIDLIKKALCKKKE
eukprot:gene1671-440_t